MGDTIREFTNPAELPHYKVEMAKTGLFRPFIVDLQPAVDYTEEVVSSSNSVLPQLPATGET